MDNSLPSDDKESKKVNKLIMEAKKLIEAKEYKNVIKKLEEEISIEGNNKDAYRIEEMHIII